VTLDRRRFALTAAALVTVVVVVVVATTRPDLSTRMRAAAPGVLVALLVAYLVAVGGK
jgi:drug/metabolite transporter superfamily protein YnfA